MAMATEKQMNLINKMELLIDVKFKGKTVAEASQFITRHMERYRAKQEFVFNMVYNENNY